MKVTPEKARKLLELLREHGEKYSQCTCNQCVRTAQKALEGWDPYEVDSDATDKAMGKKKLNVVVQRPDGTVQGLGLATADENGWSLPFTFKEVGEYRVIATDVPAYKTAAELDEMRGVFKNVLDNDTLPESFHTFLDGEKIECRLVKTNLIPDGVIFSHPLTHNRLIKLLAKIE